MKLPQVKGQVSFGRHLGSLTWLKVGGPAKVFFRPFDCLDLKTFLSKLSNDYTIFPIGVGSNLLVRDGGINAVVIRLGGKSFNYIEKDKSYIRCGAGALDSHVAIKAAEWGLDLTFLRTIPGTIGGAVAMNSGCYGSYIKDFLVEVKIVNREGIEQVLKQNQIEFGYRSSNIPSDTIIVEAVFEAPQVDSCYLKTKMAEQLSKRNSTQPISERTAGSTFRNPSGKSSIGLKDDDTERTAWKLIDDVGLRGFVLGGAQVSDKHPNFLVNRGNASSKDFEELGELIRKKVLQNTGIELQWEVIRVGVK